MDSKNIDEKLISFLNKMLKDGVKTSKDVDNIFLKCLDQLRSIGITTYEAFKNILPFLVLRMIEPLIDEGVINIEDEDQYENEETSRPYFETYKEYLRFSNLYEISKNHKSLKGYDIVKIVKIVFTILSSHKTFIGIVNSHSVQIEDGKRTEGIISLINALPVERQDLIGEGYELFLKRFGEGKTDFAQFFTPQFVRNFIVETMNIQPEKSILDPAAGSGGFLLSALDYMASKDEDFDYFQAAQNLYGKEIQQDTLLNCKTNILLKSGYFSDKFDRIDSLQNYDGFCYDYVISNPPFGLKGASWEDTESYTFRNDYDNPKKWFIPIRTDGSTSMFMQAIVSYTAIGGKCAIVLPFGKEMTYTEGILFNIRKAIFTACKITHFIELPKGTFKNASSISTCIIFLEKVYDFNEIMAIKNTGKDQTIKFLKKPINSKINIMTINQDQSITDLGFRNLDEFPNYVLSFYENEVVMDNDYDYYALPDICTVKRGKRLIIENFIPGPYPVIGGGTTPSGFHNDFNTEPNIILITNVGMGSIGLVSRYKTKIFCSDSCFRVLDIDERWDNDFLYCYLKYYIQDFLISLGHGTGQPGINLKDLQKVLIPLYPMKMQLDIAEKVLRVEEIYKRHLEVIEDAKYNIYISSFNINKSNSYYLKDIFKMSNGKPLAKKDFREGPYFVVGAGKSPIGMHDEYNTEENTIIIAKSGYVGQISRYDTKIFLNGDGIRAEILDNDIATEDYIYTIMKYYVSSKISNKKNGMAQKHVTIDKIENILIPIPSIEEQDEYVKLMTYLESKLEDNEKMKKILEENLKQIFIFYENDY